MKVLPSVTSTLAASSLTLALAASLAIAQPAPAPAPSTEYAPTVGQQGKDVVWVPTPQALVDRMLAMAKVTPKDTVVDLGSGDGRTVITAAKLGATARGIEYNPDMVALARRAAEKEGVKVRFDRADIFQSDFSDATVITLFLLPDLNVRLRPTILDMKPGTRVVSNTFNMGDWEADDSIQATENCTSYCRAYFWVVPAKVAGNWKLPQGELSLEQKYQMLSGTLKTGSNGAAITNAKMVGDQIQFTAGDVNYVGRVSGNTIEGTSRANGKETAWKATRG